jgi:hypothetical protein
MSSLLLSMQSDSPASAVVARSLESRRALFARSGLTGSAARRVAATLDALSRRDHWTGHDDPVFVTEVGSPIDYSKSTKAYRQARQAAGVQAVRFHDLRHTFGTHAVRNNPVTDVKEWRGHADISTTMVYVHYVPQHQAAMRLGRSPTGASTNSRRTLDQRGDRLRRPGGVTATKRTDRAVWRRQARRIPGGDGCTRR